MSRKHVFRILPVVTVASGIFFGLGLAHAGTIEDVDRLVERADDLTEHADAVIEASDGVVESLDAIVEEVDAIVEDALALKDDGEDDFVNEAMDHADELIEAADSIAEGNIFVVEEAYDLMLDADSKIEAAIAAFPGRPGPWTGPKNGVLRKAYEALDDADSALEFALSTICSSFNPDVEPEPCDGSGVGAIGLAKAADVAIEYADQAVEASIAAFNDYGSRECMIISSDLNPVIFDFPGLQCADAAVEAADAAVEESDAAIEAADAAIEAADKAVEKADRLVEAAGG